MKASEIVKSMDILKAHCIEQKNCKECALFSIQDGCALRDDAPKHWRSTTRLDKALNSEAIEAIIAKEQDVRISKGLDDIYEYYGEKNQINKLEEEAGELAEAANIHALVPSDGSLRHLEEEAADVLVVMVQLFHGGVLSVENVMDFMEYKIDRQLKRIEEEKEHEKDNH